VEHTALNGTEILVNDSPEVLMLEIERLLGKRFPAFTQERSGQQLVHVLEQWWFGLAAHATQQVHVERATDHSSRSQHPPLLSTKPGDTSP
jgi:hypothetical protein